jgi:hypothetical protein
MIVVVHPPGELFEHDRRRAEIGTIQRVAPEGVMKGLRDAVRFETQNQRRDRGLRIAPTVGPR